MVEIGRPHQSFKRKGHFYNFAVLVHTLDLDVICFFALTFIRVHYVIKTATLIEYGLINSEFGRHVFRGFLTAGDKTDDRQQRQNFDDWYNQFP